MAEVSQIISLDKDNQAFVLKLFWEDFPCMYEMSFTSGITCVYSSTLVCIISRTYLACSVLC